jgi:hypothetical protein
MTLTPEQRAQNGRLGALTIHAQGKTNTAPARAAFDARFERQVDPDGVLTPTERAKRAAHARKLHFARMAAASAKARKRKRGQATEVKSLDPEGEARFQRLLQERTTRWE